MIKEITNKVILCDKCNKDISKEDFYMCNIDFKFGGTKLNTLRKVAQGDFCEECFKKILKDEFNFKKEE